MADRYESIPFEHPGEDEVEYVPWTDGFSVGFCVVNHAAGSKEYVYLTPSTEGDDNVPTVFAYQGAAGDPSEDGACVHFALRDVAPKVEE